VLINWRIKGLKTKAAAAPVNNFYPQKRERKKKKKKEKYSYLIRRTDWAVKVFLPKYDLSVAKCGDYGKNPKGTDLYCPKRWSVLAALSLLDFLFFLSVNIILKKSLLYFVF
jgi:hypothetical protein